MGVAEIVGFAVCWLVVATLMLWGVFTEKQARRHALEPPAGAGRRRVASQPARPRRAGGLGRGGSRRRRRPPRSPKRPGSWRRRGWRRGASTWRPCPPADVRTEVTTDRRRRQHHPGPGPGRRAAAASRRPPLSLTSACRPGTRRARRSRVVVVVGRDRRRSRRTAWWRCVGRDGGRGRRLRQRRGSGPAPGRGRRTACPARSPAGPVGRAAGRGRRPRRAAACLGGMIGAGCVNGVAGTPCQGLAHEVRHVIAGHVPPKTCQTPLTQPMRSSGVGVAHPHRGRQGRGVTDEPGVGVVAGRARSCRRPAGPTAAAVPVPLVMTPCSTLVTLSATLAGRAVVVFGQWADVVDERPCPCR